MLKKLVEADWSDVYIKYAKIEFKCRHMYIKNIKFWEQMSGVASIVAIWYRFDGPFLELKYLI